MKKYLLIIVGCLSLGLGIIAMFLPVLPTTPFLLLSAGCFLRSSKSLYDWLLNHKYFGEYIKDIEEAIEILMDVKFDEVKRIVIERLKDYFEITIIYYNPNIEPFEEYEKRKFEQIKIIKEYNLNYMDCDYDNDLFHKMSIGLEHVPEKGIRCHKCYKLRLNYTANKARENNFKYFGTTLTVSPHKLSSVLNEIGLELENEYNVKFLVSDFKKNNGYKNSIELSKKYNLYRQNYCGCKFARKM